MFSILSVLLLLVCNMHQGTTSLEAVQLVADLVRKKKCAAPPLVVSSLLVLRFDQVKPVSAGGEGAGGGKAKQVSRLEYLAACSSSGPTPGVEVAQADGIPCSVGLM